MTSYKFQSEPSNVDLKEIMGHAIRSPEKIKTSLKWSN